MKQIDINTGEMDELLIKCLTGSATEAEYKVVQIWMKNSNENKKYFNQLKDIYFLGKITKKPSRFDKQQSLDKIKSKYYKVKFAELNKHNNSLRIFTNYRIALSIAATFIIALITGFYLNYLLSKHVSVNNKNVSLYNEVVAPKGSRSVLTLPDGTKVWLNAGSKLSYPMDFMKENRIVSLVGEAFFEVTKIHNKRFIVKTSDLDIKVWGTKFNVKAYPEEKTILTTLVEGSVSIQKAGLSSKEVETYLIPNQTAVFYKSNKETKIEDVNDNIKSIGNSKVHVLKKVNTLLYTSWKDDKWIVEGQTLGELAVELERRYNVNINFETDAIKKYKFNGIFTTETLEQLLTIIKLSAPIDFSVTNNKIRIKENTSSKILYDKYLNH